MAEKERTLVIKELASSLGNFDPFSKKHPYYFKDYNDNLIGNKMNPIHKEMFEEGSGSELNDSVTPAKAKAIDSSSMLSYNFFRNIDEQHPLQIDEITYNKVFFEVKLRTLQKSNMPANIDVVLLSTDGTKALFIESKFLEYLIYDNNELSKTYLNEDSYFDDNEERKLLILLANQYNNLKNKRYNYGIKQNICHLIGISNLKCSEKAKGIFKKQYKNKEQLLILKANEYYFMNVLFEPKNDKAHPFFDQYTKDLKNIDIPVGIKKKYIYKSFIMTYKKIFEYLEKSNTIDKNKREKLLHRYIMHHQ